MYPSQRPTAELYGGTMDCGSGLLLLLMRSIGQLGLGQVLLVHTEEPSVPPDLVDWARLAGHEIIDSTAQHSAGPWQVSVRRGGTTGRAFGRGRVGRGVHQRAGDTDRPAALALQQLPLQLGMQLLLR